MRNLGILAGLAASLLLCPSPAGAQEVYRNVSSEKLEALLKDMNISARKVASKNDGIFYYHFKQDNRELRLHNYNGKDLWIDCIFIDKLTPEQVNRWNMRARPSRAVMIKDGTQETVSLETQLDCVGGVTDAMIRRFISRFNVDLNDFSKFMAK